MTEEPLNETTLSPYEQLKQHGEAALAQRELDKALEFYQQALEVNPQSSESHKDLGDIYLKLGFPDKSEEHYLKALSIDTSSWKVLSNLAVLYCQTKKYDSALFYLQKLVFNNKAPLKLFEILSDIYIGLGKYDSAEIVYSFILLFEQDNLDAQIGLAKVDYHKGYYDSSIDRLLSLKQKLLEKNEYTVFNWYYYLGFSYKMKKNWKESLEILLTLIEMQPDTPEVLSEISTLYSILNHPKEASIYCLKSLEIQPAENAFADPWFLVMIAPELTFEEGHLDFLINSLTKLTEKKLYCDNIPAVIAAIYNIQEKYDEALIVTLHYLKSFPKSVELYRQRALSYYFKKNSAEYKACLDKILEIEPNHDESLQRLNELKHKDYQLE